jgi:four helix bundle protein
MATGLENLKIYQMAKELEIDVYRITKSFPLDEKFRSVDQLRRSSSSVTNNIAEAYNKQSLKEKIRILRDIAISEAEETRSNLLLCAAKDFADKSLLEKLAEKYRELMKATNGYIRFLKTKNRPTD